jgi:hypothetical protein
VDFSAAAQGEGIHMVKLFQLLEEQFRVKILSVSPFLSPRQTPDEIENTAFDPAGTSPGWKNAGGQPGDSAWVPVHWRSFIRFMFTSPVEIYGYLCYSS